METCGGFVEDVEVVFAAFDFAQFVGEFDALGFATGEDGGGVSNFEITEAQAVEDGEFVGDEVFVGEKSDAVFDGHVENIGNGFAVVGDFEGFVVVACAFAGGAGDFDVGHEGEAGFDDAFTAAFFTATAFDVEAEARGGVAALFGFVGGGEDFADVVVKADVGGRV